MTRVTTTHYNDTPTTTPQQLTIMRPVVIIFQHVPEFRAKKLRSPALGNITRQSFIVEGVLPSQIETYFASTSAQATHVHRPGVFLRARSWKLFRRRHCERASPQNMSASERRSPLIFVRPSSISSTTPDAYTCSTGEQFFRRRKPIEGICDDTSLIRGGVPFVAQPTISHFSLPNGSETRTHRARGPS